MESLTLGLSETSSATWGLQAALFFATAASALLFVGLFSSLGIGPELYGALVARLDASIAVAACAPAMAFIAWFVVIAQRAVVLQVVVALVLSVSVLTATVLAQLWTPSAPLGAYVLALPLWAYALHEMVDFFAAGPAGEPTDTHQLIFAGWRASAGTAVLLLACGLARDLAAPIVVFWPRNEHFLCATERDEVMSLECERRLLMWALPYGCAAVHCLYALVLHALTGAANGSADGLFVRFVLVGSAIALAGIWLGAELAGVAFTASHVITMYAFVAIACLFVGLLLCLQSLDKAVQAQGVALEKQLGRELSTQALDWKPFNHARRLRDSVSGFLHAPMGDWLWALLFISPAPPLFAAYTLADMLRTAVHRGVRRYACARAASESADTSEDWAGLVSAWTARRLREMGGVPSDIASDAPRAGWLAYQLRTLRAPSLSPEREEASKEVGKDWSAVLSKAILLGLTFVLLRVGSCGATFPLLSLLLESLAGAPLPVAVGCFAGGGLGVLLLPFVPGALVYLAGGLLITPAARPSFGFAGALALATGTCFGVKLLACLLLQGGLGRWLSSSVAVRAALRVNSRETRALKAVLAAPGLSVRKACLLVGGPDFPTSVAAGALGCGVWGCLLHTTPVLLFVAPHCALGALHAPEPPLSARAASALLGVGVLLSVLKIGCALLVVNGSVSAHESSLLLTDVPYDQDVLSYEQTAAQDRAYYLAATHWRRHRLRAIDTPATATRTAGYFPIGKEERLAPIPAGARAALLGGWACAWVAVMLVLLRLEQCFAPFEITSSIREDLEGNVCAAPRRLSAAYSCHAAFPVAPCCRVLACCAWSVSRQQRRKPAALPHHFVLTRPCTPAAATAPCRGLRTLADPTTAGAGAKRGAAARLVRALPVRPSTPRLVRLPQVGPHGGRQPGREVRG